MMSGIRLETIESGGFAEAEMVVDGVAESVIVHRDGVHRAIDVSDERRVQRSRSFRRIVGPRQRDDVWRVRVIAGNGQCDLTAVG